MEGINWPMVFYSQGFFGYGEKGDFRIGSLAHIIPVLLLVAAVLLLYRNRGRLKDRKGESSFRLIYVAVMILIEMSYYWRLMYTGPAYEGSYTLMDRMPLQVCQWTLLICCFMMLKKSEDLFSMVFFLTMSTSLLAIFFPEVIQTTGPGYYRYYQFWGEHLLPVFGMFYMMFVFGYRVRIKGMVMAFAMLIVMTPFALQLNKAFDASYLYLANTFDFSVVTFLPDSMFVRILLYAVVVWAFFGLDYLVYSLVAGKRGAELPREENKQNGAE